MISANMRNYSYYIYSSSDEYGQATTTPSAQGTIKMSIDITSQNVQANIKYKDCTYLGLTTDKAIDDTYVIQYGNEKLKVMYVNSKGRLTQVFMSEML